MEYFSLYLQYYNFWSTLGYFGPLPTLSPLCSTFYTFQDVSKQSWIIVTFENWEFQFLMMSQKCNSTFSVPNMAQQRFVRGASDIRKSFWHWTRPSEKRLNFPHDLITVTHRTFPNFQQDQAYFRTSAVQCWKKCQNALQRGGRKNTRRIFCVRTLCAILLHLRHCGVRCVLSMTKNFQAYFRSWRAYSAALIENTQETLEIVKFQSIQS